ncbi:TrkA family potassium uptake protein [Clostridium sp. D2Q-14]|uniref:potassium channel family protein n=1 Tax=Anaeromonas gelatinilytica TaxID=2683194 RepID=UPI00193B9C96|nr:TrkA family potassium uptake protein [Anaeromonas gelatinilytica]
MNIIIVGGGKEIHFLTKSFISKGYNVTIINDNKEDSKRLAKTHEKAVVVNGDGTKPYVLEDAGAAYCHMIIALTPKDPDNLVICQISDKMFKIKKKFAIVNDPKNVKVFKKLGVDTVISTASIISSLIEQRVSVDDITNLMPIEAGKVAMMEIEVKEDYPILNNELKDISLPKDAIISCILRKSEAVIPRGDTGIEKGDKLIILSLPKVQSEVLKVIRGRID